jgi:hypothetical protein
VYTAKESDVSLTVVDGRILWDGYGKRWRTLDATAVMKAASEWREKITKSLAPPPPVVPTATPEKKKK